jgi:hypothetical protein
MDKNTCVISYQKAESLISTCCNSFICQTCLEKQESMPQPQKCAWCRRDMTLTGFIDLPNAFQVFRKVKKVLREQDKEEQKEGSAARVRQYIM